MELKVYRIDRSLFGRVGHFFKKPDLPVDSAMGLLGNPFKVYREVTTSNCYILSDPDEIRRFRNPLNEELQEDVYYIRHPKKALTDCLIPAKRFHAYVLREQIADIVSYIRANANVKRLRVSISDGANAKLGVKGIIDDMKVEGDAKVSFTANHEVIIECNKPLKASEKRREYIWMEDFSSTRDVIDEVSDGTVEIRERYDFSMGLNAKVADMIGVDAKFRASCHYHVKCELA
jgi:hypothetical protein